MVHANCIITTDLTVGAHVILNLNSSLTHDDIIEDYVTIQPGVAIAGSVHIGEGTEVGTGSSIIQGVRIGAWSQDRRGGRRDQRRPRLCHGGGRTGQTRQGACLEIGTRRKIEPKHAWDASAKEMDLRDVERSVERHRPRGWEK